MALSCVTLQVNDLANMYKFYTANWGMHEILREKHGEYLHIKLAHSTRLGSAMLHLIGTITPHTGSNQSELINHTSDNDVYWKHGFNAANVDLAVAQLQSAGVKVEPARQLKQSGYFTHLTDPQGYKIELLQFTFEGRLSLYEKVPGHPLKQQPTFGMISLRVKDIDHSLRFYCDALGMRLLCRVDESDTHAFKLYFLAFTDETPPCPDLDAVVNREWLFQREYTVLELLVYDDVRPQLKYHQLDAQQAGFKGLSMTCSSVRAVCESLDTQHIISQSERTAELTDPDGIPVHLQQMCMQPSFT